MRQESPTGDYDRALEDERRANMTGQLIRAEGPRVKYDFANVGDGWSIREIDAPAQGGATLEPAALVGDQIGTLEGDDLEAALDAVLGAERAGGG
jgi:hypothetical protein